MNGRMMQFRRVAGVILLPVGLAVLSLCSGCGNKAAAVTGGGDVQHKNSGLNRWLTDVQVDVPPSTYRVEPPDVLRINTPAVKELDKAQVRVRPDGKITLPLISDVYVAGMSPPEIAEEIVKRLGKFYQKETLFVSIDVVEFLSKKYYVFGYIDVGGVKPYTGRDTIAKVLAEAKLNRDAWPEKVVLIRPHENPNVRQRVTVDLKKMMTTGDMSQNYLLEEGDLVYVPPSPLAEFRMNTEKLLAPIAPATDLVFMGLGGF